MTIKIKCKLKSEKILFNSNKKSEIKTLKNILECKNKIYDYDKNKNRLSVKILQFSNIEELEAIFSKNENNLRLLGKKSEISLHYKYVRITDPKATAKINTYNSAIYAQFTLREYVESREDEVRFVNDIEKKIKEIKCHVSSKIILQRVFDNIRSASLQKNSK